MKAHRIFPRQQYIAAAAIRKLREIGASGKEDSEGSVHGMIISQQPDLDVDAFISLSGPLNATRPLVLFPQR